MKRGADIDEGVEKRLMLCDADCRGDACHGRPSCRRGVLL